MDTTTSSARPAWFFAALFAALVGAAPADLGAEPSDEADFGAAPSGRPADDPTRDAPAATPHASPSDPSGDDGWSDPQEVPPRPKPAAPPGAPVEDPYDGFSAPPPPPEMVPPAGGTQPDIPPAPDQPDAVEGETTGQPQHVEQAPAPPPREGWLDARRTLAGQLATEGYRPVGGLTGAASAEPTKRTITFPGRSTGRARSARTQPAEGALNTSAAQRRSARIYEVTRTHGAKSPDGRDALRFELVFTTGGLVGEQVRIGLWFTREGRPIPTSEAAFADDSNRLTVQSQPFTPAEDYERYGTRLFLPYAAFPMRADGRGYEVQALVQVLHFSEGAAEPVATGTFSIALAGPEDQPDESAGYAPPEEDASERPRDTPEQESAPDALPPPTVRPKRTISR